LSVFKRYAVDGEKLMKKEEFRSVLEDMLEELNYEGGNRSGAISATNGSSSSPASGKKRKSRKNKPSPGNEEAGNSGKGLLTEAQFSELWELVKGENTTHPDHINYLEFLHAFQPEERHLNNVGLVFLM
jgi:hypothetical protein